MTPTTPEALAAEVTAAIETLREKIVAYRKETGALPPALRDGIIPPLPPHLLTRAKVYSDRNAMMLDLAKGGTGAEIGVQAGNFSRFLLSRLGLTQLHLFDLQIDTIHTDVKTDPRVRLHKGDSSSNLLRLAPGSLDWAYIDGDHSFQGAMRDARGALATVRSGGLIFFNDYTLWSPGEVMPYGVIGVVNTLVSEGHEVAGIALSPWGYFDIAIWRI